MNLTVNLAILLSISVFGFSSKTGFELLVVGLITIVFTSVTMSETNTRSLLRMSLTDIISLKREPTENDNIRKELASSPSRDEGERALVILIHLAAVALIVRGAYLAVFH